MRRAPSPERAASQIRKACPNIPRLAIVLGTGFADSVCQTAISGKIAYSKIDGFPRSTTAGHPGFLSFATLDNTSVLLLNGRAHFYEGYSLTEVTFPVRVLAALGVQDLLLTNAAGGINRAFSPGDFMLVSDHINFLPENPLRGLPGTGKFVDLTRTYDLRLNRLLRAAARSARVRLHSGIYLAVSGPNYETPAEIKAFEQLGADAVGMSTVPEAIIARYLEMRVAAVSCITNFAAGKSKGLLSHAEVLTTGKHAKNAAEKLLKAFVTGYARCQ